MAGNRISPCSFSIKLPADRQRGVVAAGEWRQAAAAGGKARRATGQQHGALPALASPPPPYTPAGHVGGQRGSAPCELSMFLIVLLTQAAS